MVLTGSCYRIITFRGFVLKVSRFYFISWMNFVLPGGPNAAPSPDRGLCRRERRGVRNHRQINELPPDGRQRGLTCGGAGGTCPLCCRRCPFRARDAPAGSPRRTLGKCLRGVSTCSCPWGWRSREHLMGGVRDPRRRKESGPCSPTSGTNVSEAVSHSFSPSNQPHGGCCLATRGSILKNDLIAPKLA